MSAESLTPRPGFVVKTTLAEPRDDPAAAKGTKVFINVCHHKDMAEPEGGLADYLDRLKSADDWSVPILVSPERSDVDHAGTACIVYDCCANTKLVQSSLRDRNLSTVLIETCLELVETAGGLVLSRAYKLPKMVWKGPRAGPIVYQPSAATPALPRLASYDGAEPTEPSPARATKPLIQEIENEPPRVKYEVIDLHTAAFPRYRIKVSGGRALSEAAVSVDDGGRQLYVNVDAKDLVVGLPRDADSAKLKAFYETAAGAMSIFV